MIIRKGGITSEDMDEFTVLEVDSFEEAKDLISSPYYMHWDRTFILNADTDEVIKEYKYIYPDIPGSNKRVCEVYVIRELHFKHLICF